ncbi:MAG: TIM barrel protein [Cephaloticoccus sp.]|nr:TIM barrel protein [Cephaloticoccus sp.]MCF7759957.1 TIM barrel protein [Cephaloticoccus sp.]
MLCEMAELGFTHVELSHGIRITLVPGIMRAVEEGVIKIGTTHNFCPLPAGVNSAAPNLFEPSATDHREHDQWLRYTKRTIDFAAQVSARLVVCHLGSVEFFWFDPGEKLGKFIKAHQAADMAEDKAYLAVLAKCMAKLRKRMGPFWTQTRKSVAEIFAYAADKGIILGFENREKFTELPLDDDYLDFMAGLPAGSPAGYWHDTGHADIKERMGLLHHRLHLEKMAPHLAGFHLHDVNDEGRDHQPVGSGHIDFKMISEFWKPEHLLVLELGPRVEVDDVKRSKARIEDLLP